MTATAQAPPAAAGRPSLAALSLLVFGAGTGTLAMEIAASRLLAPYFGSSTIVWANIIGLALGSLSLGYWLGGRLADRRPDPRLLGGLVLGAALLVTLIPFVAQPFLDLTARGLDRVSAGAVVGSFLATLLLFAPPIVVLGMVSPFAIRLAIEDVGSAGAIAGRLYALSTVGSLLGTFLSALVTIPLLGTQRTLLGSALVLALTAALLLRRRWLLLAAGVAALLLVPPGVVKATPGLIHEEESTYQYVQVVERDGARRLYLNEGIAVHSLWRPDTVLTGGVWDTFLVPPRLLGRPPERLAILGSAGGTIGRAFGVFHPAVEIDGVEIDAAVTEAGERWLGLGDNPRVTSHEADARPFLRATDERYDLIYADAYHQPYVPFYLATREFFELVRSRLRPGGIVALNVATVPGDTRLPDALGGTLASVFPQVLAWQALRFNQLVVGFTEPVPEEELARRLRGGDPRLAPLFELFAAEAQGPVEPLERPWTDDRAPVEWTTDRMIVEYGARGGRLDEDLLPTAPER